LEKTGGSRVVGERGALRALPAIPTAARALAAARLDYRAA
jgi:hypothetical protein